MRHLPAAAVFWLWSTAPILIIVAQTSSRTKYDHYAGYLPTHSITDLAALDLDQYEINQLLSDRQIDPAYKIYQEGGHSGSYANITLINDSNSAGSYPAGTIVVGQNDQGGDVIGTLLTDVSWDATNVAPVVQILYPVGSRQASYSDCTVGGLWRIIAADRDGCFRGSGSLSLGDNADTYSYDYNERTDNNNLITLQGLSKNAVTAMKVNNQYIPEYQQFLTYYGDADYADKFVTSAFHAQHTNYKSTRGNFDFSRFQERMGRAEAMRKGNVYLHIWMQVVLYLHSATNLCHDDSLTSLSFLDNAVALYTGSLTADTAEDETGILLHGLADARGQQFRTAGHQMDTDVGTSYVNIKVMDDFRTMKQILSAADPDLCDKAELTKQSIITLMKIPLIQGLLRYTYIRQYEMVNVMGLDDTERTIAESATFAATILPFLHTCSPREAMTVYENIKIGSKSTSYDSVQRALMSVYSCLGIEDCNVIGGIWDSANQEYKPNGRPCGLDDPALKARSPVVRFFRFAGITLFVFVVAYFLLKYKNRILAYVRRTRKQHSSLPQSQFTGNIAAVAEIS